jgi:hypothetical protein
MHALLKQHSFGMNKPIPNTVLVQQISHIINQETNLGVQDMVVFIENEKMILTGNCRSFRTKQLAQAAALKIIGDVDLVNRIHVA